MAPEYRVRFVGDLGNLSQFNSTIRSSLGSNNSILRNANTSVVSRALGGAPVVPNFRAGGGAGFSIRNAVTELDRYNNAIVQSGTVVRQFIQGYKTEIAGLNGVRVTPIFGEAYQTDFRKAIANLDQYSIAVARLAPVEAKVQSLQQTFQGKVAGVQRVSLRAANYLDITDPAVAAQQANILYKQLAHFAPTQLAALESARGATIDPLSGSPIGAVTGPAALNFFSSTGQIDTKSRDLVRTYFAPIQQELSNQEQQIRKGLETAIMNVENDPVVQSITRGALYAATNPEGYVGQNGAVVLQRFPQVRQDLIKRAGLGQGANYGTQQFLANAEQQGFQVDNVYKDLERNVTRISGQIKDTSGIWNQFSYAVNNNGKIVQTWGRTLSGARGFISQTTRDLVKFTEWVVAGTLIMGAFGAAIGSITTINKLNSDLQRFSITARLSNDELNGMFKGLSQIAYQTATPLTELVSAADDMALATRRANQSTEEWHASILELANAVGILTNISGLDTVRATDLLVASMKQLDLTTKDLVPLLSQITAAAGGQANSITDIATSLASLSEAAKEAGVDVTHQIAAIQVISLATNKSADETASAFKNLFGAVNADISVKKLKEFGIAVRDAQGSLRPFLDIYKDIADAINSGVIPQGRVNEVLRAISGGRTGRQADAAALIANIYKVFEVQQVAFNASNEALIANAKILDTNQAKITQFQTALQTAVFEKFNKTVQDLTSTLSQLGTTIANVIGLIPQPLISLATQVVALYTAFTLLSRVGSALGISAIFNSITKAFRGTTAAAAEVTAATRNLPIQMIGGSTLAERQPAALSPTGQALYLTNQQRYGNPYVDRTDTLSGRQAQYNALFSNRSPQGTFQSVPFSREYTNTLLATPLDDLRTRLQSESTGTGTTFIGRLNDSFGKFTGNFKEALRNNPISNALLGSTVQGRLDRYVGGTTPRGGILNNLGGLVGGRSGALGLGIGAAIGAVSSGTSDPRGILASAAQFGGMGLTLAGAPEIGLPLILGATLLQNFMASEEEVKKQTMDLQQTLYNMTEQWKIDQAGVSAAQLAYDEIKTSLGQATAGTQEYMDLQKQLSSASVDVALATQSQHESLSKMVDVLTKLNDLSTKTGGPNYATFLKNFKSASSLSREDVDQLVGLVSGQILSATGQPVTNPNLVNFNPSKLSYATSGAYNVSDLLNNPSSVIDIVNRALLGGRNGYDAYGNIAYTGPQGFPKELVSDPAAVVAFRTTLTGLKDQLGADKFQQAVTTFEAAVAQYGSIGSAIDQFVGEAATQIQAKELLGVLYGNNATNAGTRLSFAQGLQRIYGQLPQETVSDSFDRAKTEADRIYRTDLANTIQNLLGPNGQLNTANLSGTELRQVGRLGLQGLGIQNPDDVAIARYLKSLGATDDMLKQIITDTATWAQINADTLDKLNQATQDFTNNQLQSVSNKLLDLQAQLQGGDIKSGSAQYKFLFNQYTTQIDQINKLNSAMKNLNTTLGDSGPDAAEKMAKSLNNMKIAGLQGLPNDINTINGAFLNWMSVLNLSGPQMARAVDIWIRLWALAAQAANMTAIEFVSVQRVMSYVGKNLGDGLKITGTQYGGSLPSMQQQITALLKQLQAIGGGGIGTKNLGSSTGGTSTNVGTIYLTDEQKQLFSDPMALVKQAYADALKLQSQIPGEKKRDRNDIVTVFDGLNKIFQRRGISEELMRKALDNLTSQLQKMSDKADTVRRIRVGAGDFAAIANVPVNSATGVSLGGNNINVVLNLTGSLTPAQMEQLANMIAANIARRL